MTIQELAKRYIELRRDFDNRDKELKAAQRQYDRVVIERDQTASKLQKAVGISSPMNFHEGSTFVSVSSEGITVIEASDVQKPA